LLWMGNGDDEPLCMVKVVWDQMVVEG